MSFRFSRRRFLTGAGLTLSAAPLSGCFDALGSQDNPVRQTMASTNELTYRAQRLLLGPDRLAPEFSESEIRQPMRPNGSTNPQDRTYIGHLANGFTDFRLTVGGLVQKPLELSLDQMRAMPSRTHVTRHDCVEGWSCIAKWTGVPLGFVLDQAGVLPNARFVMFACFDSMEGGVAGPIQYYESIDLIDARHPQTILAYGMNGAALPVSNGAPLRVRIERQLGYKMAKYISGITVTDTLAGVGGGKGGYWEDYGYDWFAGI